VTLDPKSAAAALSDVARAERRTKEAARYAGASIFLFWWGGITTFGYLFGFFRPIDAGNGWRVVMALGVVGSIAISYLSRRKLGGGFTDAHRMILAQLALILFGALWIQLFGFFDYRALDAFWPTLFMLGYVLLGLWLGRVFVAIGLIVTALTVAGYLWSGPWFGLWMAVVNGGGLIAGGVFLRRIGLKP
jgi:hypothetical protein